MPWCPKCGIEYREDFKTCSDCNSDLVEKPELPVEEAEPQYDKEAFLISVGDSIEADMVEALLNTNGIPVLKKYREAGDYMKIYMGGTNFGVDLYVPGHLLGKAQEIINNTQELNEGEELPDVEEQLDVGTAQIKETPQNYSDENTDGTENDFNRKRRVRTWVILIFFIPGIIWVIILLLYRLYQWLTGAI